MTAAPTAAATRDLHGFLEQYERDYPDEVIHLEQPFQAEGEVGALLAKLEKAKRFPVVVFHNVIVDGERAEVPLVALLMSSRLRLARALGVSVEEAGVATYQRVQSRIPPVVVDRQDAPVKQVVEQGAAVDVRRLPAPRHHTMDPGRYITAGLFLSYNRQSRLDNSAMQRGWLSARDEIRVFLASFTHNAMNLRQYEQAGEDMPAAYWIGHHPLALLGAQTHVGAEESHFETAGGALGAPLRLVPSETLGEDFLVPADAEIVVEGYVPRGQRKPEGPFGEYTRHFGPQRWGAFLKVTAVTRRRDAYWDDIVVGHTHWMSSLTREGEIYGAVKKQVSGLRGVHLPMSGCGSMNCYLKLRKHMEGQGKSAAMAALAATFGIKHVFVFDEDVDIFDEKEVLMAFATRFQAERGLIVANGVTGSPLDPSSPDGVTTSQVGFDCTKPLGQPFAHRLEMSAEALQRIDPVEALGRERFDRLPLEPWG